MRLFHRKTKIVKDVKRNDSDKPHLYNLYMPHSFYIQAKEKAMREYKSLAAVIRGLLEEWLNEQ